MKNKIVLITGANSGIGKATATRLAIMGAYIVMLCRNKERGETARQDIIQTSGNNNIELILIDLTDLGSVRKAAEEIKAKYDHIDVMLNNAGGYFEKRKTSKDGYEYTFAMNHLGHFLLTNLLLDELKAAVNARIINLSSDIHKKGHIYFDDLMTEKKYKGFGVYSHAKLANILFTNELSRRLQHTNITVNTLHPGMVRTNFTSDASRFIKFMMTIMGRFLKSPEKGAETSVYLASSKEVDRISGKYFVNRKEKKSSPESYDEKVAKKLWKVSCELTGLDI
ncbi:MAG: SDR family oxidoreductase [Bacteroidales bacterium]|nr:SDR family oxidoreductase [Bacteroidales bacterium]